MLTKINRFRSQSASAFISLTIFSSAVMLPAYGGKGSIPSGLLDFRGRAQTIRRQMLKGRAENMRCLSSDEKALARLDKAMAMGGSAETKRQLAAYRANLMGCIASHKVTIATIDKSIIDTDRDLAYVESQITRYACMR